MTNAVLTTILLTGFTVAFLHAAIPTHWLPFVLTARVQAWGRARTLGVVLVAGFGHVLFTAVLGALVAWGGITLSGRIGSSFPLIAGGALLLFGLYYLLLQARGKAHGHSLGGDASGHEHDHRHGDHSHPHAAHAPLSGPEIATPARRSDRMVVLSLLALLTFSPCEGFLPVYVSGVRYGWGGFLLLTFVLSLATVGGMMVFTWLTLAGFEKLKLAALEKYEAGVLGGVLILLGLLVIFFEH
jgi:hypothetical protein